MESQKRAVDNAADKRADAPALECSAMGARCTTEGDKLKQPGMPHVFATGYDSKIEVPAELEGFAYMAKPNERDEIAVAAPILLDNQSEKKFATFGNMS